MNSKHIGRCMLVVILSLFAMAALSSQALALTCTDIGGSDVGGDCTLNSNFVCSGNTTIDIPGDFVINAAINCSGDNAPDAVTACTPGWDLTINVGGDWTHVSPIGAAISSNGGAGFGGTAEGGPGQTGCNGGNVDVNVAGNMTENGHMHVTGGSGGSGAVGGGIGTVAGNGGTIDIDVDGLFHMTSTGHWEVSGSSGGSGGPGGIVGDGGDAAQGGNGGILSIYSCGTTVEGILDSSGGVGGSGGAGGTVSGDGGDNASGGNAGIVSIESGTDLVFTGTSIVTAIGGVEGSIGNVNDGTPGANVGTGGNGGIINRNACVDFSIVLGGALFSVAGGNFDGSPGVINDLDTAPCCACSVVITKQVALDDNCDGIADSAFGELASQDDDECVVYEICVENTGDQDLDASGVQVSDTLLGIVDLDYGTIASGADPVCQTIAGNPPASNCTEDPDSCVCTEVEGVNTAVVSSAICSSTQTNACDDAASDCDDTAEVECLSCEIDIDKTVALDDDCDGIADGPFQDGVIQDEDECVVYKICVENTGSQELDASGVIVDDVSIGVVSLDFGTLAVGSGQQCQIIPVDHPATDCTSDPDSCVCSEVEGTNTASVSSAVCSDTGRNACDDPDSNCDDSADVECPSCSVEIDKTVALDDDCDGIADGPFQGSVTQEPDECVIYEICVTNTGEQDLNGSGVEVNDPTLGVVDLDFGTIASGADPVCMLIPVDAPATLCELDPDSCVCSEVVGRNTASITSAICTETEANACDQTASVCEDFADVACVEVNEICRTPGFWGTHGGTEKNRSQNITQAVIDEAGCLNICGEAIDNTSVDSAASALEAICVHPSGAIELQLVRQLTAAALNCVISGGGQDCSGVSIENVYTACNIGCEDETPWGYCDDDTTLCDEDADCTGIGDETCSVYTVNQCVYELDCFNNGGQIIEGQCVYGTCAPEADGIVITQVEFCQEDSDCGPEFICEHFEGNCHDRELCNEDLDLCFDPPGPAGSSKACNDANQNECAVIQPDEDECASNSPDVCL